MLYVLLLVTVISVVTTALTYKSQEGFQDTIVSTIESLTPQQREKLSILNDPTKFVFVPGERLEIRMPVVINRECRILSTENMNGRLEIQNQRGVIGGYRLHSENDDVGRGFSAESYHQSTKGGVPLLMYYTENGTERIHHSLAGHSNNFRVAWSQYIPGYPKGYIQPGQLVKRYSLLRDAKMDCWSHPYCQGVTYDRNSHTYTLRGGNQRVTKGMEIRTYPSPSNEISWVKITE
jgi:hypothetical protein